MVIFDGLNNTYKKLKTLCIYQILIVETPKKEDAQINEHPRLKQLKILITTNKLYQYQLL